MGSWEVVKDCNQGSEAVDYPGFQRACFSKQGGQPQCGLASSLGIFIRLQLSEVERMIYFKYLNRTGYFYFQHGQ